MRRVSDRRRHLSGRWTAGCAWAVGMFTLTACAAESSAPPGATPAAPSPAAPVPVGVAAAIRQALAHASQHTGLPADELQIVTAESVTWPDGSLGCPQSGMAYTQALVAGFRVKVRAGDEVLDYHSGRSGTPTLCPPGRARDPLPDGDPTR